jgi:hypothetical protein
MLGPRPYVTALATRLYTMKTVLIIIAMLSMIGCATVDSERATRLKERCRESIDHVIVDGKVYRVYDCSRRPR